MSLILTLVIAPNSAKALTIPTGYGNNWFIIKRDNPLSSSNSDNTHAYYIYFTNFSYTKGYVQTLGSDGDGYCPYSGNPYCLKVLRSYPQGGNSNAYLKVLFSDDGDNWTAINSNRYFTANLYEGDGYILKTNVDIVNLSQTITYYQAGYEYNPIVYPSWSISSDVMKYDGNNILYNELDLVVSDKDLSTYSYEYRVQSFDGSSWLTDWSPVDWYYNSDHFHLVSYSNFRYNLRITDISSSSVVYDDVFVVSSFYNSNYKEYLLNNDDYYFFISGFHNINPVSSNVVIAINNPFTIWDLDYFDFTSGSIVGVPSLDRCSINNLSYSLCVSYDINQISDYDSSHTYGLRIKNHFASYQCNDAIPTGCDYLLTYNDRSFMVLNSLYVSSSGSLSTSGAITNVSPDYIDSSDVVHQSTSLDSELDDFGRFYNTTVTDTVSHHTSFFTFFGNSISYFFLNLSTPLASAWLFCFSLFLFCIIIKIWL